MSSERQRAPAQPKEQYQRVSTNRQVPGTEESNTGIVCPYKLGSVELLRHLLMIFIPCVCAFICVLVIVLAFLGVIDNRPSLDEDSKDSFQHVASTRSLDQTTNETYTLEPTIGDPVRNMSFPILKIARFLTNVSITYDDEYFDTLYDQCNNESRSPCEMLPFHQTISYLDTVQLGHYSFIFHWLQKLKCYKHILLFWCSIAFPGCINDTESSIVLPCASFCEEAMEGCGQLLKIFTSVLSDVSCSWFVNDTGTENTNGICFSPQQLEGKKTCKDPDGFLCGTDFCIPRKLVCNGYKDCEDWSDEANCTCDEGEFHCGIGKCIHYNNTCDGYDDCGDLSDEMNCECNPEQHFRCGDGRCITKAWVCDGDNDCIDMSDEANCSCSSLGMMECNNTQCIPRSYQCDGYRDCEDMSDELQCSYFHGKCEPITFKPCMNLSYNTTIYPNFLGHMEQKIASSSWMSDRFSALFWTTCYKYSIFFLCTIFFPKCDPETNQPVPPCRSLCEESKDHCELAMRTFGYYWPSILDCSQFPKDNHSDNHSCLLPDKSMEECSPSDFKCKSGKCISASMKCDGNPDCDDSSDEKQCECSPSDFKCKSGKCISASMKCDGDPDCDDFSDEKQCGCSERNLWECPTEKICIKPAMRCDGFQDCADRADEKNCSSCADHEMVCNSYACVSRHLWCDGRMDCPDGSDEWNCVSLSSGADSFAQLIVHRSTSDYYICADDWHEELSQLACKQIGLGGPAGTRRMAEHDHGQWRKWLRLSPDWRSKNMSMLQALLVTGEECRSKSKISLHCTKEDCGQQPKIRLRRILGGRTSRPGRWPWQGSLQIEAGKNICGCVLIRRKWVLTVAHCFQKHKDASDWRVVFGINNLKHPTESTQTRTVKQIIIHPRYERRHHANDISLLELHEEINVTSYVRPVCLPRMDQVVELDTYCSITGWGSTGSNVPMKLQEGGVRILPYDYCRNAFGSEKVTSRTLCAGYQHGTVDACEGDSGGPLVCEQPGKRWTLFGLTALGHHCSAIIHHPGVYSNVTHFVEWIERQIYINTFL
ncbi:atrial natriuretic peptide-converting enzyme isoform X2 [Hypanus sabinus]|uniref:atrial natriuretic peptide-converting enzyme isoform X2 n=1 Tax=Hypanus sabinus TaxID=79690 RepID=UPI0028C3F72E|nr:atrial natriuretic peptide-converting enzyme isoform X2 [Hypanus sabinus]